MADRTLIEVTEATWNPITGCSPVSPGCRRCYAARFAKRLAGRYGYPKDAKVPFFLKSLGGRGKPRVLDGRLWEEMPLNVRSRRKQEYHG